MQQFDLYQDIASRTDGDIYIGVVGPVRTGKSTFITKFMQSLVLPNVADKHRKQRIIDELPQSADGKTVMTTQPKFVPDGGVEITLGEGMQTNIRLIDCVGYPVEGAEGFSEGEKDRLVTTPWSSEEMPFSEAAELGTHKVIADHSTIGIVLTTDGSIADLERGAYVDAERRVIEEMKELGKPFVVLLNSKHPEDTAVAKLADDLSAQYGVPVVARSAAQMSESDITDLLSRVLMEFPLTMVDVVMPKWLQALPANNEIISHIIGEVSDAAAKMGKMADYKTLSELFTEDEFLKAPAGVDVDFGTGNIKMEIAPKDEVFYKVLSMQCGQEIEDDFKLVSYIKELSIAKREYDKVKDALAEVEEFGYGVVTPDIDDMVLEAPEIIKRGNRFAVKLRASAPSLHIMRVDVTTEVSPAMGAEAQNEEMLREWLEQAETEGGIWQSNMFGKTLNVLAREGLSNKLMSMPEDARVKLRRTVTRIVNEGKGGVLCILL